MNGGSRHQAAWAARRPAATVQPLTTGYHRTSMYRLLALLLLTAVVLTPHAPARHPPAPLPDLQITGPPEAAPDVRRLQHMNLERLVGAVRLSGLADPGPPIRVLVVPEGSSLAEQAPSWVAGYATGAGGAIVVFPARAGAYPYDSLEELLQHEVAHVLIDRAAGGRPVPRWLHEGIAMTAGDRWGIEDDWRFAVDLTRTGEVRLAELDRLFARPGSVSRAYAVSGSFVNFLLRRHGPRVTAELLAEIAAGRSFDDAFGSVAGETLGAAEEAFWRRQTLWFRWVPLATSSTVLWIGVTALALVAIVRRRHRDAELRERWAAEEAARLAGDAAARQAAAGGEAGSSGWIH